MEEKDVKLVSAVIVTVIFSAAIIGRLKGSGAFITPILGVVADSSIFIFLGLLVLGLILPPSLRFYLALIIAAINDAIDFAVIGQVPVLGDLGDIGVALINAVLLRSKWPLAAVIPEFIPGVETIPSHVLAVLMARREE